MLKVLMIGAIVGIAISILRTKAYSGVYDTAKNFIMKKVAEYV